jgi:hypothetical protein
MLLAAPAFAAPGLSLGAFAGAVQPDPELAGFQWDAGTRAAFGLEALLDWGGLSAGLRLDRWSTRQGAALAAVEPQVRLTALRGVGRARLFRTGALHGFGEASLGWLAARYSPAQVTIEVPGGDPVTAELGSPDAWTAGLAAGLGWTPAGGPWTVSAALEGTLFPLDTAHRRDDEIVVERRTFTTWSARLGLSWTWRPW